MSQLYIGWEVGLTDGVGSNLVVPLCRPITVTAYQIKLAMGCTGPGSGFTQLLSNGVFMPVVTMPPMPEMYPSGVGFNNSDWEAGTVQGHPANGNAYGVDGALFSSILKTNAPDAVNDCLQLSGLNVPIPAGYFFVLHADLNGQPVDFEVQGVIFYE